MFGGMGRRFGRMGEHPNWPNLVVNGDFGADAAWTKSAPGSAVVTISGGTLNLTGDGSNFAAASQEIVTQPGVTYTFTFTTALNNVNWAVGTSAFGSQLGTALVTPGTHSVSFVATTTSSHVGFSRLAASAASVDNVSVRAGG